MKREANGATWLVDVNGDGEVGQLIQYLGIRDNGKLVRGQRGDFGVGTFPLHDWHDDG